MDTDQKISRRKALTLGTGAAAGALLLPSLLLQSCNGDSGSPAPAQPGASGGTSDFPTLPADCSLYPELTEGPYYVDVNLVRKDVTEGKPGTPLALRFVVVDSTTCAPLASKMVEIWHADASGVYSDIASEGTAGQTQLRGTQMTDANGIAEFASIYPGWYQGRATHIHFKVHTGTSQVATSQIFFDDSLNDMIYAQAPYNGHSGTRLSNQSDSIFNQGGAGSVLIKATMSASKVSAAVRVGVVNPTT